MPVIQETFYIPNKIMIKIITGEYRRTGGIIRYATGPNKGKIVKHLDPIELKEVEQCKSLCAKVVQFAKNNKKTIIVSGIIIGGIAVGTYIYFKVKKDEAKEVKIFQEQLKTYIDELKTGTLQLTTIENLINGINELQKSKSFNDIRIELSAEELSLFVKQIRDYTIRLAEINNYSICNDELQDSNDSIENLRNCLTIQKNVFEFAA